jgi:hypothetical protein
MKSAQRMDYLANLYYEDFGIKDASKMIKFLAGLNSIRYETNVNKSIKVFADLNIAPKSNLKRWQKFLEPDSIKLLNNLTGGQK